MYTVKEVAEILGVSAHTVRYYDGPISIHPVVRMIYFLNRSFYRLFLPEIICLTIFKIVIICISDRYGIFLRAISAQTFYSVFE